MVKEKPHVHWFFWVNDQQGNKNYINQSGVLSV